jgi:D-glycero-D-manno-heptose 1,7-bisphosphate phosphatase
VEAVRQAVVLVGGRGTRLGAIAADTPKPLLPIAPGVAFLDVLLGELARHGFTDIILLAGHLGDQVSARYHGRAVREASVRVVREPAPLGTGGALWNARAMLDPWFLLANGDSLFDVNLRALSMDASPEFVGRLALRAVADTSRYGSVTLDGAKISAFREKAAGASSGLVNAGIYLLNRSILDFIAAPCSIETDVFPGLADAGLLQGRRFDGYFLDIGLPDTLRRAAVEIPQRSRRPAAFLDRDGVLNRDFGHVHDAGKLVWMPGAKEAVRRLNDDGYYVLVVTNQAGIGKGLYDAEAMNALHRHMQDDLAAAGAHVDAFYHCPFHPEATIEVFRHPDHPDRKPNAGMILRALRDWPVEREGSFLVGDQPTDLQAARSAGLPGFLFDGVDLADTVTAARRSVGRSPASIEEMAS